MGLPGSCRTALRGNNNLGDLAGTFFTSPTADPIGFIAPLFEPPITFKHPDPTVTGLVVGKINDWRAVVGYYTDATGAIRGFLRQPKGNFVAIDVPGADATQAYCINDCGVVVGRYVSGGTSHGFYGFAARVFSPDVAIVRSRKSKGPRTTDCSWAASGRCRLVCVEC